MWNEVLYKDEVKWKTIRNILVKKEKKKNRITFGLMCKIYYCTAVISEIILIIPKFRSAVFIVFTSYLFGYIVLPNPWSSKTLPRVPRNTAKAVINK